MQLKMLCSAAHHHDAGFPELLTLNLRKIFTEKIFLCCNISRLIQNKKKSQQSSVGLPILHHLYTVSPSVLLPFKVCFSQKRYEEQREEITCSAGGKALIWSTAKDQTQGKREKLVIVPSRFFLNSNTGPFRSWGTHLASGCPSILSANANIEVFSTQPSPQGSTCENIGSKEIHRNKICAFQKSSKMGIRKQRVCLFNFGFKNKASIVMAQKARKNDTRHRRLLVQKAQGSEAPTDLRVSWRCSSDAHFH